MKRLSSFLRVQIYWLDWINQSKALKKVAYATNQPDLHCVRDTVLSIDGLTEFELQIDADPSVDGMFAHLRASERAGRAFPSKEIINELFCLDEEMNG